MIVTLIVVCEVGFWVLLAAGLGARYLLRMPKLGMALLLCEPLLEILLLVVTAMDLKNGAEPAWRHSLAALYIGYTVGHGHRTVKWLDGHAAHRFGGGPPPVKAPKYGMARAHHEGRIWLGSVVMASVASGLLLAAVWYVGGDGDTSKLEASIGGIWRLVGIHGLIALTYAIWPKKAPEGEDTAEDGTPALKDGAPALKDGTPAREDGTPAREDGAPVSKDGSAVAARDPEDVADLLVRRPGKDEEQVR